MNTPWVESPFFETALASMEATDEQRALARQYNERGYLVLEGLLDGAACEQIVAQTGGLFEPTREEGRRSRYRVQDAWPEAAAVRSLAAHPEVMGLLRFLYDRAPIPFQTLNFLYGSQQHGHSDAFHFSCRPSRFMCGLWVALEDVSERNGPLFIYPGSHRLPEYDLYDIGSSVDHPDYAAYEAFVESLMAAQGFERKVVPMRQGDALLWAAHLVHGGMPIGLEGSTRHSQVTHYFFEDCFYFTPAYSNPIAGEYALKEVVHVATGERVPHRFNGRAVRSNAYVGPRSLVRFDADAAGMAKVGMALSPRGWAAWGRSVARRKGLRTGKALVRRVAPGVAARVEAWMEGRG